MATEFVNQDGSYDKSTKDGNTQASNKFGGHNGKTTDNGSKPSQSINKPTDSGFKR